MLITRAIHPNMVVGGIIHNTHNVTKIMAWCDGLLYWSDDGKDKGLLDIVLDSFHQLLI
jgi:hypothetical protein